MRRKTVFWVQRKPIDKKWSGFVVLVCRMKFRKTNKNRRWDASKKQNKTTTKTKYLLSKGNSISEMENNVKAKMKTRVSITNLF